MLSSYFSPVQQTAIACAVALAAGAMVFQYRGRDRWAIGSLTLAALVLRLFAATLDPYLNSWDEVFHAVVAKNMLHRPFTPMLHWEPAMPTTSRWAQAHIWLHKPPFFLWQIALSLKVFGLHAWAVRLPSVLWMTAVVPVTWRMAQLLTNKVQVAFAAALFMTFSVYLQELTAGMVCTDHNDTIFIGTVACSWWAWMESVHDHRWKWVVLVGVFSACAVLTKWYVGLSVFLPWGLVLIRRSDSRERIFFTTALGCMLLLVGSWVVSIAWRYPDLAAFQWWFKTQHFAQSMDGHTGAWSYHLDVVRDWMPPLQWWVVVPAITVLIWQTARPEHRIFLLSLVLAIHLFFGLAQTKMVSYTMVLLPLYMIAVAYLLVRLVDMLPLVRVRAPLLAAALVVLSAIMLDIERTQARHTDIVSPEEDPKWRRQQMATIPVLQDLAQRINDPEHAVVFNMPRIHHLQFMFQYGYEAWDKLPTAEDVARLGSRGYNVYALQDGLPLADFPAGVDVIPDSVLRVPQLGRP